MDENYGIEREKEALAELDKIREAFEKSRLSDDQRLDAVTGGIENDFGVQTAEDADDLREDAAAGLAAAAGENNGFADDAAAGEDSGFAEDGSDAQVPAAAAAAAALPEEGIKMEKEKKPKKHKKTKEEKKAEKAAAKNKKLAADEAYEDLHGRPRRKHPVLYAIWLLFLTFVLIGVVGACVGGYYALQVIKDSPEINPGNIYDMLSESSVLYDANGDILMNIYKGNEGLRNNVDYKDLPENLKNAFICIEDKTFWEHNGFNVVRIIGAVWNTIKSGGNTKIQGTSTITQQLARNIFLSSQKSERSMVRKIREAYYTILIEKALSKEQILEAYLNTVYLGYNTNGVGAAAKAYFNKDVKDLTVVECAMLAALPQNPLAYSPLKRIATKDITDKSNYDIVTSNSTWTVYYNNKGEGRLWTVLKQMHDQGKLDDETYAVAQSESIRSYLNPGMNIETKVKTTYFSDYVVSQVLKDLQSVLGYTYTEAYDLLYSGGLIIYSTIDPKVQSILDSVYSTKSNFPNVNQKLMKKDSKGNILNDDTGKIMIYLKSNVLDSDGNFKLTKKQFEWKDNGALEVFKNDKLSFIRTMPKTGLDYVVYFKDMYYFKNSIMYTLSDCYWNIDAKYKTRDDNGDLWISPDFFADHPDAFKKNSDGSLTLNSSYIVMKKAIIQPQSAAAIVENKTGYLRGLIGGRGISGSLLFNRAINPRQTGSSIKPLTVYSTALQQGYENSLLPEEERTGPIYTAAYPIDDAPGATGGRVWPKNVYANYTGITYLRDAVERSVNACAVNLYRQLDPMAIIANLDSMGITTIVKSGNVNDLNPAALALGGLSKGISPLEMASAYTTFANYGVHVECSCYTKVVNRRGDVILEKKPESTKVFDEAPASLMLDILRTNVLNGGGKNAKLKSQPSAGKTGTTSEQFDVWFCGCIPKYSCAVWIGCDSNVRMGTTSSQAAKLWATIMGQVGALNKKGSFQLKGSFVTVRVDKKTGLLPSELTPAADIRSEIFIKGTQPTTDSGDLRQKVQVCAKTGYLATPLCPKVGTKSCVQRPAGISWEEMVASFNLKTPLTKYSDAQKRSLQTTVKDYGNDIPGFYCPLHNPDTSVYPISPLVTKSTSYNTDGIEVLPDEPDDHDDPNNNTDDPNNGNNNGGNNGGNGNGGGNADAPSDPNGALIYRLAA